MDTTKGARIPLTMGDPPLYLIIGETAPCHRMRGPAWVKDGTAGTKIHCMSKAAGGEIRGYWLITGELWIDRSGSYFDWPELDADVALATGLVPQVRP